VHQIENYSNYEMGDDGTIYSKERVILHNSNWEQRVTAKLRKPIYHHTGYYVIGLRDDAENKIKTLRYHIIVAKTLVPNPNSKPYVNHIDGNKLNFHPSNLEWVTAKENTQHAIALGLCSDGVGVNNYACRFTIKDVCGWLQEVKKGETLTSIATKNKSHRNTISKLVHIHFPNELPKYTGNYKDRLKKGNQ